ncbi:MAG: 4'-phosphopantetheinyl transferase [Methylococcus sp.]
MNDSREIRFLRSRLAAWLPSSAFIDVTTIGGHAALPEEEILVRGAVDRRKEEFRTGRWLLRKGARHLGRPARPIGIGPLRAPLWPEDILGSLSHDGALCIVALMAQNAPACPMGFGIDLVHLPEKTGRMNHLLPYYAESPDEAEQVAQLDRDVDPALLLFSLKESFVKALSVHVQDYIDLSALRIGWGASPHVTYRTLSAAFKPFVARSDNYLLTAVQVFSPYHALPGVRMTKRTSGQDDRSVHGAPR